jgi:hypothetical protein
MKSTGGFLLAIAVTISLFSVTGTGSAAGQDRGEEEHARVITDGRLRPGRLEPMRVTGFPGKGNIEVSFFPTAICEDECGARSFRVGRTDARGAAKFRVHVPGTFIDQRHRSAYFRDGERIEVDVIWEGSDHSFDFASANPEPIIVRAHGSSRG